jgi:hypothetical protein
VCSTPLTLSVSCWGPEQWAPLTNILFTSLASVALNYPRPVVMNGHRVSSQIPGALSQHPTGSFVNTYIFFAETTTCRDIGQGEHLSGGPPSTSSLTSVVAAVGATDGTSQGAHHRHLLQHRWWLLSELSAAPPRGAAIDVFFNFGSGYYRSCPQHLPKGPLSTSSSTSVVVAAEATGSTSQGCSH